MSHFSDRLSTKLLAWFLTITVPAAYIVWPNVAEASHLGSSTASAGNAFLPVQQAIHAFQPDLFTGRATTAIPIVVPPGRKGMQPALALSYASANRNGWVGVGWDLTLGHIERSTKNGPPRYDPSDTFVFNFQGVQSELVQIPDGSYRAKDEGLFLRFRFDGTSWEVRDKSGTKYLFGASPNAELRTPNGTFRWCLEKVVDTNGNYLEISYVSDQGMLYPAEIRYTGHEPTSEAPAHKVVFTLEDRPDRDQSQRSGSAIVVAKRLQEIACYANTSQLARKYVLSYTLSPRTQRSLLTSVQPFGTDGATNLPATTFTYTQDPPQYLHCHNCVPSISSGNHGWQLQYAVGNLFPRDANGNDQRLWPSGAFDPGQQCWNETVCQDVKTCHKVLFWTSCDHQTVCSTVTRCNGISPVSWSRPYLETSGASGGVTWSTDANGNLNVNGPQDAHVLAMTWLYTNVAKTVSLSNLSVSGRADVFYVPPGGSTWSVASGQQVPLSPGWTVVAVTAYHETGSLSLSISANLASAVAAMNHAQFSPMSVVGDFNGDGLTDLGHLEPAQNHWHVALNSPNGFWAEQTWLSTTLPAETAPLVGDVDANGKADLILWNASSGLWQVAKSTGTSFAAPTTWQGGFGTGGTPFVGDVNGDQLLDFGAFVNGRWDIAISNGSSCAGAQTWLAGFGSGAQPLTGDFNGDGLTDVAAASGGTVTVALSDGTRLVTQPAAWTTSFGAGQQLTSADFNGDGLTDVAYYDKATGTVVVAPSTGAQFGAATTLMSDHPFSASLRTASDVFQVGDFRGDGLAGFGVFNAVSGAAEIVVALGTPPDLLRNVANGVGGTTTLTYTPSSAFDNTGEEDNVPDLPFVLPVVTQVDVSDGLGHTYTTRYDYAGGRYDVATKEFRGFRRVDVRDAANPALIARTWFYQTAEAKGRPQSQITWQPWVGDFRRFQNWYGTTTPYPGVTFTALQTQDVKDCNGDATCRVARTWFYYDAYGNLTTKRELGEYPGDGDERETTWIYNVNEPAWLVNTLREVHVHDGTHITNGPKVSVRIFYYDDGLLDAPPTKGNLTREREWLVADPHAPANEQWPSTWMTYDAYGNVATVKDALNRTTTNTYDTATHAYLTQITNALGHTRNIDYDARLGVVTNSTDPNGQTTRTVYDALGRVTRVVGPTDTDALPTVSYEYDLSAVPTKTATHTRVQSGEAATLDVYAFADGLGRTLQTRAPAEAAGKQVVTGNVEFDARGLVVKAYLPYLADTAASYQPPAATLTTVRYEYDLQGRLTKVIDPDGSVAETRYDDWAVITTDAKGHATWRATDAFGRLSQVDEVLDDGTMATTTYAYDVLDHLTQVADAQGHLTTIAYDALGRKLSMNDPDMGVWAYAYDAVDNLTSQTDARGVTTSFTYDTLNRLTKKTYAVPAGSGIPAPATVAYAYDDAAKPFSKGKLTSITDGSGSSSFEYDALGRLTRESKTVDGQPYTIQRGYDLLGRLTALTYPDGEIVRYTYNAQGGIETITGASPYVTDVSYNAAGQLTKLVYGNGVVSDYTYHPQTLRLDRLKTTGPAGTLQDFTYGFDAVGNVTQITDAVHTGTQSFLYDNLDRLTQASGSYGVESYHYDAVGNMTGKGTKTMQHGRPDGTKPHAVTASSDGRTFSYDANGNMRQCLAPTGLSEAAYTFDAENRLTRVERPKTATVTLHLKPGWNFVALPVVPADVRLSTLLPTFSTEVEQVARRVGNSFEHYVGQTKFDDFTTLEANQGYQLYCKKPEGLDVTLTGILPGTATPRALAAGWQLLGAPAEAPRTVAQLLNGLVAGVDVGRVLRYDASSQQLVALSQSETVAPGEAVYVEMLRSVTWQPPGDARGVTAFLYDGDGGRVKVTTPSGTTRYLGSLYEVSGSTSTKHVFAGSLRIVSRTAAGTLQFSHGDHLGSSHVVTDGAGQLVSLTEYTPYGELAAASTLPSSGFGFTGQRFDASAGLYFYNARYYDPTLGRFLSPDALVQAPGDPQTLNRYSYVRNNPVNFTDPTGQCEAVCWFLVFIAVVIVGWNVAEASAAGDDRDGRAPGDPYGPGSPDRSFHRPPFGATLGGSFPSVLRPDSPGLGTGQGGISVSDLLATVDYFQYEHGLSQTAALVQARQVIAQAPAADPTLARVRDILLGLVRTALADKSVPTALLRVKLGPGFRGEIGFVKRAINNRFVFPGSRTFGTAAKSFAFPVVKTIGQGLGAVSVAQDLAEMHASLQPGGFHPNFYRASAFFAADSASFFSDAAPPFTSALRLLPAALKTFDLATQQAAQSHYGIEE